MSLMWLGIYITFTMMTFFTDSIHVQHTKGKVNLFPVESLPHNLSQRGINCMEDARDFCCRLLWLKPLSPRHTPILATMDEGTIKTPIPKRRLQWWFLGCRSNFVGSESGQKQNVKLLPKTWSTTQLNTPPTPHSHTLSVYTVCLLWGGGGGWGRSDRR